MTTRKPLIVGTDGKPAEIVSGDALGGITGGTATGEAMTQDQFGTNYDDLNPTGNPTFCNTTINQEANGDTALTLNRFTDTSPTGNFLSCKNAAATVKFQVAASGAVAIVRDDIASAVESFLTIVMDGDSTGNFSISNGTSTNATFNPKIQGIQKDTGPGLNFGAQSTTDTGTGPVLLFASQIGSGAVAVRPVAAFRNLSTDIFQLSPGLNIALKGGSTSPTLDAAAADTVSLVGVDAVAGDRQLYARTEGNQANRLTGLSCRVSTDFSKTSDTTLANITGLTRNVRAGESYAFRAVLFTTSANPGGIKLAVGGTATATSVIAECHYTGGLATPVTSRVTALATAFGESSTVTAITAIIEGSIVVNAAGTLTIQFAQNASNGTASTVLAGSYLQLISIGN